MNAVTKIAWALALALPALASADMLPDVEAAGAALWSAPMVRAAQAELEAQKLGGAALAHGGAEWNLSGDLARRKLDTGARDAYGEWGASVSRPLRLPARAAADRALGEANVGFAEASLGEALHESGRELLRLWFDWLGESRLGEFWAAQIDLATQQRDMVAKRVKLGEAAHSESVAIEAALAQARHQQRLAEQRAALAHGTLRAAYPGLVEPAVLDLPEPEAVAGAEAEWIEASLAHNHELARARADAERLARHADQLRSRSTPDPSVGLFVRRENGSENVIGVNLGLTLPGAARRLEADAARLRADAAVQAATLLEARLAAGARLNFVNAQSALAAWREADAAATALEESARLAARSFELGEGELGAVLAARRLAIEGRLAATGQRRDAQYAAARLRLDAHRLWPLDVHPEDEGHMHH